MKNNVFFLPNRQGYYFKTIHFRTEKKSSQRIRQRSRVIFFFLHKRNQAHYFFKRYLVDSIPLTKVIPNQLSTHNPDCWLDVPEYRHRARTPTIWTRWLTKFRTTKLFSIRINVRSILYTYLDFKLFSNKIQILVINLFSREPWVRFQLGN